jgi:hypothetical protein
MIENRFNHMRRGAKPSHAGRGRAVMLEILRRD